MQELPAELHDRVAAQFCRAIDTRDPLPNLQAGFAINDPQVRAAALQAAVKSLGLPEDARATLQEWR